MKIPVTLVANDGSHQCGEFVLWEESPDDSEKVKLELSFKSHSFTSVESDFFEALRDIRRQLEPLGFRPKCFGSCRNAYPSPMALDMGPGLKVYLLRLGSPAKLSDLVPIFDSSDDIILASVEEQQEFYDTWSKTFHKGG